jgi:polyhydroxyalkanoate synthesis regulator phasin
MRASLTHSNNLTPIDLECPFFQVYHFCMLENKELSGDEAKELLDHINECKPCQSLHNEIKAVFAGSAENKPSRVELLTYLKCSMNQITSLTEELHAKFLLRHRLKAKKRMAKAENRIRELEKQVAQLQAQVHELLKAANPPTLKAPDDLECSDLEIHHFLMNYQGKKRSNLLITLENASLAKMLLMK